MDLCSNKSVDQLYKASALVLSQSQAVRSNEYDCLIDNNLEMFEVIKNALKNRSAMMVFQVAFCLNLLLRLMSMII